MWKRLLIIATLAPALALSSYSAAGASSTLSNLTSPAYSFGINSIPKGFHVSSLGTLYKDAKEGDVTVATVNTTINVVLFKALGHKYAAQYVAGTAAALTAKLLADNINVTVSTSDSLASGPDGGFPWPPLAVFGFTAVMLYIIFLRRGNVSLKFWKRRAPAKSGIHSALKSSVADVPTTTFDDVAGIPEAVADMREIVEFLKDPKRFELVGAKSPSGALMVGPPGTGKTLLARAVAGEAGVPFFAVAGSDFSEMYVGVGPKRIRELFARAKKAKHGAIIFIDEIDAVARKRSTNTAQASDSEHDNTLMALLSEMDGFTSHGVVVLAATNRPDILDPAITRPGRLDRRIEVPHPDRYGREIILRLHSKRNPLANDVDLERVSQRTSGLSGADLANIVNEAAINAARRDASEVTSADFDAAIMTTLMGRARTSAIVTDKDRMVTAYHEAGHTVCAYLQDACDPPVSVSIIPRGLAGGVTAMSTGDDNFMQRSKAAAQLVSALGGRAAEELLLGGDYTQGACGDLTSATSLATAMATNYGMTTLGLMVRERSPYETSSPDAVTVVVEEMLMRARTEAITLLRKNITLLSAVADELLAEDTLDHLDLDRIYAACGSPGKVPATDTLLALYGASSTIAGEIEGVWDDASSSPSVRATPVA